MKKLGALLLGLTMLMGCTAANASTPVKPQQQIQMEKLGTNSNCYEPLMFYIVSKNEIVGQEVVANMVMSLSDNGYQVADVNAEETVRQYADVCLINPDKTFSDIATIYAANHK